MSFSHSSRAIKYPLERFFNPDSIARPQGLKLQIPRLGNPQIAGIAFEILVNLRLAYSHSHNKAVVKNLRSHLIDYLFHNPKLEADAWMYSLTGELTNGLLANVWLAAKRQQDMHAWGMPQDRRPKKAELEELRILHDWIVELKLAVTAVILTGGNYLSKPDLLVRSRSKNIVYEFKLVSDLERHREHLTQGLLYLFDYSCSGGNPVFDELWLFYPRYKFIQKINIRKALLPEAGEHADIYRRLRRLYIKNRK